MINQRVIRFRAWLKELEEMVDADQVLGFELCPIDRNMTLDRILKFSHLPIKKGAFCSEEENSENYILMQFTGLTDKNGKEIYEGDICKLGSGSNIEIVFNNGGFGWYYDLEFKTESWIGFSGHNNFDIVMSKIEVVGNIYENSDLIN